MYCLILAASTKFITRKYILLLALIFSSFIIAGFFLAHEYDTRTIYSHISGLIMLWFLAFIFIRLKEEQVREQQIRKENEAIYNRIDDMVFGLDKNWNLTYKNSAADRMGYSFVNVGDNLFEKMPGIRNSDFDLNLKRAMASQKPITFNYQTIYTSHLVTFTIYPSEEGVSIFSKDITELEKTRDKLAAANERIYKMFNRLDDLCFALDNNFKLTYVNDKVLERTSKKRNELVGHNIFEVYPSIKGSILEEKISETIKTHQHISFEMKSLHWKGRYISFSLSPDNEGVTVIAQDITEYTEAKIKLEQALTERDILQKEIIHRVKNNLQIISSIIGLEMNSIGDSKYEEVLSDIVKRINAISIMHSKLYESGTISKVNAAAYIKEIVDYLVSSYSRPEVKVITDLEEIEMDSAAAAPVGMILNELVSNSFKYAFRPGFTCEINIKLFLQNGCVHLVVRDNGAGYPQNKSEQTLGMQLIKFFAEQLEGSIQTENRNGAYSELEFNI